MKTCYLPLLQRVQCEDRSSTSKTSGKGIQIIYLGKSTNTTVKVLQGVKVLIAEKTKSRKNILKQKQLLNKYIM